MAYLAAYRAFYLTHLYNTMAKMTLANNGSNHWLDGDLDKGHRAWETKDTIRPRCSAIFTQRQAIIGKSSTFRLHKKKLKSWSQPYSQQHISKPSKQFQLQEDLRRAHAWSYGEAAPSNSPHLSQCTRTPRWNSLVFANEVAGVFTCGLMSFHNGVAISCLNLARVSQFHGKADYCMWFGSPWRK